MQHAILHLDDATAYERALKRQAYDLPLRVTTRSGSYWLFQPPLWLNGAGPPELRCGTFAAH
jgi:hypothetical protein